MSFSINPVSLTVSSPVRLIEPSHTVSQNNDRKLPLQIEIQTTIKERKLFEAVENPDNKVQTVLPAFPDIPTSRAYRLIEPSDSIEQKIEFEGKLQIEIPSIAKELNLFKEVHSPVNEVQIVPPATPQSIPEKPPSRVHRLINLSQAIAKKKGSIKAFNALDSQDRMRILHALKISKFNLVTIKKKGLKEQLRIEIQTLLGKEIQNVVCKGNPQLLEEIFEAIPKDIAKILVNAPDKNGLTPLYHLVRSENPSVACLHLLLDAGADPSVKIGDGQNFAHEAAHLGHAELLKICLDKFSNDKEFCMQFVNAPDENGYTPLLNLARSENPSEACLHLLLDAGADPIVKNPKGENFVHLTAYWGQEELLRSFLDRFSKDKEFCMQLINAHDEDGYTPLLNLARSATPNATCLDLLFNGGADPTSKNRKSENFAHLAVYSGQAELLKGFLDRFSKDKEFCMQLVDTVNAIDKHGNTPLFNCARSRNPSATCLDLLLDAGADPTMKNHNGENFAHEAAYQSRAELLKRFLDRFSKDRELCVQLVNVPDNDGYTPLSNIARSAAPSAACLHLLLDAGARLSYIPQHIALYDYFFFSSNKELILMLLEKEPRIEGFFALHLLSHVFGFEPRAKIADQHLRFEGCHEEIMIEQILADLERPHIRDMYFPFCRLDQYQELIQMFEKSAIQNRSAEELLEEIQSKKLVLINAGWKEHAISIVFRSGYLVICNRGEGCDAVNGEDQTLFARKIDLNLVSQKVIKKLIDLSKSSDSDAAIHYLYKELPKLLKGKNSPICRKIREIQPKRSKADVCSYAANKAALRAALALLTKNPTMARDASKLWATHHREWALDYFQKTPSFFDEDWRRELSETLSKRLESRKLKGNPYSSL